MYFYCFHEIKITSMKQSKLLAKANKSETNAIKLH